MKRVGLFVMLVAAFAGFLRAAEEYPLGPDSQRQPGVPQGKIEHFTWTSKIFPGTTRDYWIYVPAQYSPDKPACVMVFQDGESFIKEDGRSRVPIVFDNLIAKHDMPVTLGIFINPGVLKALSSDQQDRFNRSFEYDGMSDRYAHFLLDEILPAVAKHYNLSTKPDDRAIAGLSSGGICAFTVAWNRPDAFHRVLSFIGSFTDLRGGDVYPAIIRKTEPKPLRVFLQDGSSDLNNFAGSWWLANQSVASALEWAGYDVKFVTGDKNHDMIQGGAIMPDALRWLWRDYPKPIAKAVPKSSSDPRTAILDREHYWEFVGHTNGIIEALAADSHGSVYFATVGRSGQMGTIASNGALSVISKDAGTVTGLAFGSDGRLYACDTLGKRLLEFSPHGPNRLVAKGFDCGGLASGSNGGIYVTHPGHQLVTYLSPRGGHQTAFQGTMVVKQISASPDRALIFLDDPRSKWVWSSQVDSGHRLINPEPFYRLETSDDSSESSAGAMTVDTLGFLYVATRLGIQVCDQPGRVLAIINPPDPEMLMSGLTFGGSDFQDLYVAAGTSIYKRHLLRKGVSPAAPVKPPVPRL